MARKTIRKKKPTVTVRRKKPITTRALKAAPVVSDSVAAVDPKLSPEGDKVTP